MLIMTYSKLKNSLVKVLTAFRVAPIKRIESITSKMSRLFSVILLLTFASLCSNAFAVSTLTAEVDRTNISTDETFTLTIRYTGNRADRLDYSALRRQFDILSTYDNNSYSLSGNRITGFKEWTFVLQPKEEGRLVIPSFRVGSFVSDAIEINVAKPVYQPSQTGQDIFIETIVDKSTAFVQEQILIKYRLFYAVQIDLQGVEDLVIDNTVLEMLESVQYQTKLNNRNYNVAEFTYAAFPQSSGELKIPSTNWNIRAARSRSNYVPGMGRYEIKRLRTDEKSILVKPTPTTYPSGDTWLPASDVTVEESWSNNPENLTAGTPITRTLKIKSKGLLARQLPQIVSGSSSSAISIYPEAPSTDEQKGSQGLTAQRVESMAIVLNEAGQQTIPAVKIAWWDTDEDVLKYAEIPERIITVNASAALINEEANKALAAEQLLQPSNTPLSTASLIWLRFWQGWAALTTLLSILFFILWRKSGSSTQTNNPNTEARPAAEKQTLSMLKKYCRDNDAALTRQQLLAWAAQHWKQQPPRTLDELASLINNHELTAQLKLLDEVLYKGGDATVWNGQVLLSGLSNWLNQKDQAKQQAGNGLAPLYPQ